MIAQELVNSFRNMGGIKVNTYNQVPSTYAYVVIAKDNILAFGKAGQKNRIRSFFNGCTGSAVHTKAFAVAMAHALWEGKVEIYVKETESAQQARELEGILEIDYPKIHIAEAPELNELFEISKYLWQKLTADKDTNQEIETCANLCCDNGDVLKSVLSRSPEKEKFNDILGGFFNLNRTRQNTTRAPIQNTTGDTMRITREQILDAIQRLPRIIEGYKSPRIRFVTNSEYIFEIENLSSTGEQALNEMLQMLNGNNSIELTVGEQTNHQDGNQFKVVEVGFSTYALKKQVRDLNALNVIAP